MMYASKRRQRNFKRIRTAPAAAGGGGGPCSASLPAAAKLAGKGPLGLQANFGRTANGPTGPPLPPSNPSKRHRERLNGELETVASLLPYDEPTIQRLDKLSVLRLAVSFLQIKAHFQVCSLLASVQPARLCAHHPFANFRSPLGPVPSLLDPLTRLPSIDCAEPFFAALAQKALGAFLLILHLDGDIFYVTENIETYLGFQQSDVLHQPLFEMIHSEDRDELRSLLERIQQLARDAKEQGEHAEAIVAAWNVPIVLRFRCLLDNTCGFARVELRTRVLNVHSHQSDGLSSFVPPPSRHGPETKGANNKWAMVAICIPFVPPLQMDPRMDDPILKSKHSLELGIQCLDMRLRQILELVDVDGPSTFASSLANSGGPQSLYSFVHPADVKFLIDSHESVIKYASSSLLIYRLVSVRSHQIYFLQTSFRLFYKNGKPDSIGANHRVLTEVDGESLLEKRNTLKFKFLSFDDTLLQSPRIFQQSAAALSPNVAAVLPSQQQQRSDPGPSDDQQKKAAVTTNLNGNGQPRKGGHHKKTGGGRAGGQEKQTKEAKKSTQTPSSAAAAVGPYRAEGPRQFGNEQQQQMMECGGVGPSASSAAAAILAPPAANNAAAIFAAAQFQANILPSANPLNSILHAPNGVEPPIFGIGEGNSAAAVGWSSSGAAANPVVGPPSAGLPGAMLKRTQVTFERYYAETVDLSPYYYCYAPNGANPGNPSLMDLTSNYGQADYWTSMMAAAAAGVDPAAVSAYSPASQHFHFPAPSADLMGGLASTMLYWPQQGGSGGIDLMGVGGGASLPPFYPAPPSSTNAVASSSSSTFPTLCPPSSSLAMAAAPVQPPPPIMAIEFPTTTAPIDNDYGQHSWPTGGIYTGTAKGTTTRMEEQGQEMGRMAKEGKTQKDTISTTTSGNARFTAATISGRTGRPSVDYDAPAQLLAAHHHHPLQHPQIPPPNSATLQNTPTPSSASSTSGFRFLSEVAQTLFGQ